MTVIKINRDINSSVDKLWNVISDVDRDPEYWHGIKSVKIIKREGNIVERESFISFKNSKCIERLILYDNRKIEVEILKGLLVGKKTISLEKIDDQKTRINVIWDVHMSGFLNIFTIFIKNHIMRGTEYAISRISKKVN